MAADVGWRRTVALPEIENVPSDLMTSAAADLRMKAESFDAVKDRRFILTLVTDIAPAPFRLSSHNLPKRTRFRLLNTKTLHAANCFLSIA